MARKPNFFFIGGMRCGSTSLNLMLDQHPEIAMSAVKEPYFYTAEVYRRLEAEGRVTAEERAKIEAAGAYRTREAYEALFADAGAAKIVGESSHYLYHGRDACEAISADCRDARILICLRDPVQRLFSEYLLRLRYGQETREFSEFVSAALGDFSDGDLAEKFKLETLNKGMHSVLLEPWIETFGEARVKIVLFDDISNDPLGTMADIFAWLGIDAAFEPKHIHAERGGRDTAKALTRMMNSRLGVLRGIKGLLPRGAKVWLRSTLAAKTVKRPELEPETAALLREFYREDIERLSRVLNRDLSAWS